MNSEIAKATFQGNEIRGTSKCFIKILLHILLGVNIVAWGWGIYTYISTASDKIVYQNEISQDCSDRYATMMRIRKQVLHNDDDEWEAAR